MYSLVLGSLSTGVNLILIYDTSNNIFKMIIDQTNTPE